MWSWPHGYLLLKTAFVESFLFQVLLIPAPVPEVSSAVSAWGFCGFLQCRLGCFSTFPIASWRFNIFGSTKSAITCFVPELCSFQNFVIVVWTARRVFQPQRTSEPLDAPLIFFADYSASPQTPGFSPCTFLFLDDFIQFPGFKYHLHADDSHIYISNLSLSSEPQIPISTYLLSISTWISNRHRQCPNSTSNFLLQTFSPTVSPLS